jgi:hypothetical protein
LTGAVVPPAAIAPDAEPVPVMTVAPWSLSSVRVMPWEALLDPMLPWLAIATVKVTVLPADGLLGDQATTGTRSALWIGVTTSELVPLALLLASFFSITPLASSTFAVTT